METTWTGINGHDLDRLRAEGTDHGGNPVEPFIDAEGGWPLRCCLADSRPDDRLAIVAWSPFPWLGAYRETGPVVVHADRCRGATGGFPVQFESRDQVVRAFGSDDGRERTQVYGLNRLVRAGDGLRAYVEGVLDDPRVEFVHVHNVVSQCFNFSAARL